jgi:ArsR family transcriptional regulator
MIENHICQSVYNDRMSHGTQSVPLDGLFAALADTTRLRLLNLIASREVCVCHLVEILGQSQPKISRHLAYLRKAGIVAARREGKWMHYRLCPPSGTAAASVLAATLAALAGDRKMRAERGKLGCSCQPEASAVKISTGSRKAKSA